MFDPFLFEKKIWNLNLHVAGFDEAGRGAWAGPVVSSLVILKPHDLIAGVNDSKKLIPQKREFLYNEIMQRALSVGIGIVEVDEIDRINILEATRHAAQKALNSLTIKPDHVLIDGSLSMGLTVPEQMIVEGDSLSHTIAAASIIAKVTRDRLMKDYDEIYPQYEFGKHKGYGTAAHQKALATFGVLPIHRRSYAPIKKLILQTI